VFGSSGSPGVLIAWVAFEEEQSVTEEPPAAFPGGLHGNRTEAGNLFFTFRNGHEKQALLNVTLRQHIYKHEIEM
jgi:hypothetical protein